MRAAFGVGQLQVHAPLLHVFEAEQVHQAEGVVVARILLIVGPDARRVGVGIAGRVIVLAFQVRLQDRGLVPLEVKLKSKSMELSFDRFTRVSLEDLALMTRQLSTMISSGLSLMRALMVLESQIENKRLKATVVAIRQRIESGASLSDALAQHPKIFSQLYVAMIRAGETGGFLESSLLRVADQLEAQSRLRRQVKSAMVYPAVVSSIAVCVVTATSEPRS